MRRFELSIMRDLAYLASSSQLGIMQYLKNKDEKDIYFLFGGTMEENFVYYIKCKEIAKKFVCLDTSKEKIEHTDSPILNPMLY